MTLGKILLIVSFLLAACAILSIFEDYLKNKGKVKIHLKNQIVKNSRVLTTLQGSNEWYENNKINSKTNISKTYKVQSIDLYNSFNPEEEKIKLANEKEFINNYFVPYKKNEELYKSYLTQIEHIKNSNDFLTDNEIRELLLGQIPKVTQKDVDNYKYYERRLLQTYKIKFKPLKVTIIMIYKTESASKRQEVEVSAKEIESIIKNGITLESYRSMRLNSGRKRIKTSAL